MNTATKQYNYCIDFLKGIACIFVVFMHCEFPGLMGIAVQAVSRFCVPFFFMVSGYFCFNPLLQQVDNQQSGILQNQITNSLVIKKKVLHIAKIILYASLFYLAFVILQQLVFHDQDIRITRKSFFSWLVFNEPKVVAHQYWFLFSLLYAYVFYGILERFNLRRFAYVLAAIMFMVYIFLAQGLHLAGVKIPNLYYRNWLIEAFPYFMLGHWIHENQDRIMVTNKALVAIIVVTTLLCWVERWIMGRDFGVNVVTIPQVIAIFLYGVKNPTKHEGALQRLGRDCSMLVYILHPAVWHTMDRVYRHVGMMSNTFALYMKPLLVLGFSILLALAFNYFMSLVQIKKQKA